MAQKGKIKFIKDGRSGIIVDTNGVEFEFTQAYAKELFLHEGAPVRFEKITAGAKTVAVNVTRFTVGTVVSIHKDNTSGYILERGIGKVTSPLPFYQPNALELGITTGDFVRYDLISTKDGKTVAVNVSGLDEEKTHEINAGASSEKPEDINLDTTNLLNAIEKGFTNVAQKSLGVSGHIVTIKDGWVVKMDEAGNVIEKIEELKDSTDQKISLD